MFDDHDPHKKLKAKLKLMTKTTDDKDYTADGLMTNEYRASIVISADIRGYDEKEAEDRARSLALSAMKDLNMKNVEFEGVEVEHVGD